jgi:hypothetical protein
VSHWRRRFADHGLAGLEDRSRAKAADVVGLYIDRRRAALYLDKILKGVKPANLQKWLEVGGNGAFSRIPDVSASASRQAFGLRSVSTA